MNETPNMAPPLDVDLSTIDTSMPLLAKGHYDLRIEKAEVKPTATGNGKFIHLDMVTTNVAKSIKGEDLGAGIHVFDNVNIIATGKATPDMVRRNVASLVQAARMQGVTMGNIETRVPELSGKVVRASVDYEPEGVSKTGKAYKAKNVVLMYIKQ